MALVGSPAVQETVGIVELLGNGIELYELHFYNVDPLTVVVNGVEIFLHGGQGLNTNSTHEKIHSLIVKNTQYGNDPNMTVSYTWHGHHY